MVATCRAETKTNQIFEKWTKKSSFSIPTFFQTLAYRNFTNIMASASNISTSPYSDISRKVTWHNLSLRGPWNILSRCSGKMVAFARRFDVAVIRPKASTKVMIT